MPLPIPNLDDRSFTDLVAEMRALIPRYAPQWTDHNITDPGITFIELLAWLSEMILYRQNLVTERNYINFLKLILDRPVPVTVEITLTLDTPQETNVIIPKGTTFATPPDTTGKQIIFETFEEHTILEQYQEVTLTARNYSVVENELLGISDGSPDQLFSFNHTPILIDHFNTSTDPGAYNPNPKITVDGEEWVYVRDFLTESSEVPPYKIFTVEPVTQRLRFGDGRHGIAIPPKGAEIVCICYQGVLGKEVKIGENRRLELLTDAGFPTPAFAPDTTQIVSISNKEAEGGLYLLPFEQARKQGLQKFQERFRAVSEDDFTFLATTVFNELQESSEDRVARAKVVPRRNLNLSSLDKQEGEVSIIIIPDKAQDPSPEPTSALKFNVWKLLDSRRLVGTRHHVVGPKYLPMTIETVVYRKPNTNEVTLSETIRNTIETFLHPLKGGFDGKGWPFGRDVYLSELYQLIESIEGVDYVKDIMLNGRSDETPVYLKENELPEISEADITVTVNL